MTTHIRCHLQGKRAPPELNNQVHDAKELAKGPGSDKQRGSNLITRYMETRDEGSPATRWHLTGWILLRKKYTEQNRTGPENDKNKEKNGRRGALHTYVERFDTRLWVKTG